MATATVPDDFLTSGGSTEKIGCSPAVTGGLGGALAASVLLNVVLIIIIFILSIVLARKTKSSQFQQEFQQNHIQVGTNECDSTTFQQGDMEFQQNHIQVGTNECYSTTTITSVDDSRQLYAPTDGAGVTHTSSQLDESATEEYYDYIM